MPANEEANEAIRKKFIFSTFTKYAKIKGPKSNPGSLKAVSIAFVFPASPTVPISTEILLWEDINVPAPNPANINIKF